MSASRYIFGGPIDRAGELAALERAQLTNSRWGLYMTPDELDLVARALEALPEQTVESRTLVLRCRERARTARGEVA